MKCIGDNILVEFIDNKLEKDLGNGNKIYIPERSFFEEINGDTKEQRITNRKLVNPQIGIVKSENSKFQDLKKGDKIFFHYGAYETRKVFNGNNVFVNGKMAFFKCNNRIEPLKNIFIGKLISADVPKTSTGIYLTPNEKIIESCLIEITHAPENDLGISIGDKVYTVDNNQDQFEFKNDKYVRLSAQFIVSKAA